MNFCFSFQVSIVVFHSAAGVPPHDAVDVRAIHGAEAIRGARDTPVRVGGGPEGEIYVHAGLRQGGRRYVIIRQISIHYLFCSFFIPSLW